VVCKSAKVNSLVCSVVSIKERDKERPGVHLLGARSTLSSDGIRQAYQGIKPLHKLGQEGAIGNMAAVVFNFSVLSCSIGRVFFATSG
jgi:hypothetical protein